jgi:DNA-binding transcriptional LysR family regulator
MAKSWSNKRNDLPGIAVKDVIDSRRLLYFYHVARTKSFSVAETVLNVAQSAISRQIQQLEADLDTTLLERTGRGVSLTQFGEILYEQAAAILDEMSDTVERLHLARRRPTGQISIAGFASVMAVQMPEILRRFMKTYPDIEITAVQSTTGDVYDLLATGEVDVAILSQTHTSKKIVQHKLITDPMVLVAARSHPIASQSFLKRGDLGSLDLILPASQHGLRMLIEKYCDDVGIKLSAHLRIDSTPLMKSLVRDGRFCTILPQMAFTTDELSANDFALIPFKPKFSRTLSVACLRDRVESPIVAALMREVIVVCREYEASQSHGA